MSPQPFLHRHRGDLKTWQLPARLLPRLDLYKTSPHCRLCASHLSFSGNSRAPRVVGIMGAGSLAHQVYKGAPVQRTVSHKQGIRGKAMVVCSNSNPNRPGAKAAVDSGAKVWQNSSLAQNRKGPQGEGVGDVDNPGRRCPDVVPIDDVSRTVRAVILAGGETQNPLSRYRAMPAVPLASSLLMIDVPLNNCLRSGINKIYVLTQFQSHTLNSHVSSSYPPARFGGPDKQGWVEVLAAQQTVTEKEWYRGSADAIRKNIIELKDEARGITPARDYIILSGSAIYNMDFSDMLACHRSNDADITMATHSVGYEDALSKGIAQVDYRSGELIDFVEKPKSDQLETMAHHPQFASPGQEFEANMGIYIFKREALFKLLEPSTTTHIGYHMIPGAKAEGMRIYAYPFRGYWRDVSSLKDYMQANLDMAKDSEMSTDLFQMSNLAGTRGSMLPPASAYNADLENVILGDGAFLVDVRARNSVIGENVYVGKGSVIEESMLLGNAVYTSDSLRKEALARGERVYGVGENCYLRNCVVDENTTIGDNVKIINKEGIMEADHAEKEGYMICNGIVVVMRGAVIPDGKEI